MNAAWDIDCPCAQKVVLIALCDHANSAGECWPGLSRLEKRCGLSRQGVIDQIEALEKKRLIAVLREPGKANKYRVELVNHVDQLLVKDVDQSESTSQGGGLVVVKDVDCHQSTTLTTPVNHVDPNPKEPAVEPKDEPPQHEEPLLIFGCQGKIKQWALTQSKCDEWQESFPQTDVMTCCRKALQWTRDNEMKTAKGMPAFLGRWISKAADHREHPRKAAAPEVEIWVAQEPYDMMSAIKQGKAERDAVLAAQEGEQWIQE